MSLACLGGSQALIFLETAYERLGLDPYASSDEKPAIWESAKRDLDITRLLSYPEQTALTRLAQQSRAAKMDGGECFEHITLLPAEQLRIMAEWRTNILEWVRLPGTAQRAPGMQLRGKKAKNAFCSRRPRDAWKASSAEWLQETKRCVRFAIDNIDLLWRSDAICHHPFHELVLSAPKTLAPKLAAVLPFADEVGCKRGDGRSPPLWAAYERAVVCVLRSRHSDGCATIANRIFYDGWELSGDNTAARLRLASHAVRFAIPAGEKILRAWLEASPSSLRPLLRHPKGLCALKASLSTETTVEYLPMLFRLQKEVAARLEKLTTSDEDIADCLGCSEVRRNTRKICHRVCVMMRDLLREDPQEDPQEDPRDEAPKEGKIDVLVWTVPRGVAQVVERCLAEQEVETEALPQTESLPPRLLTAAALEDSPSLAAAPAGVVGMSGSLAGAIIDAVETPDKAEERIRAHGVDSLDAAVCPPTLAAEQITTSQSSWTSPRCPMPTPPARVQEQTSSAWKIPLPQHENYTLAVQTTGEVWQIPRSQHGNYTLAMLTTGQEEAPHKSSGAFVYPPPAVDQFSAAQEAWWVPYPPPLTIADAHFQPACAIQNGSFFPAPQTFWVFQVPLQAFYDASTQQNIGYYCGNAVQAFPSWVCFGASELDNACGEFPSLVSS